jgi:hypothetical protein
MVDHYTWGCFVVEVERTQDRMIRALWSSAGIVALRATARAVVEQ